MSRARVLRAVIAPELGRLGRGLKARSPRYAREHKKGSSTARRETSTYTWLGVKSGSVTDSERIAILGGTFTPIHNGHRALLHKAFQTTSHDGADDGHVVVGLTASELAEQTRSRTGHAARLGDFESRQNALDEELTGLGAAYSASYEIIRLEDTQGPAATRPDVDALVVSPEAKAQRRAHSINEQRVTDGLSRLEVHTAPFVVAEDGTRISSTRIRNGEIDEHGRLLTADSDS
jgi:pantetheine-phosphate adenylyltransferase